MRLFLLIFLVLIIPASSVFAQQEYSLNDELLYRINFGSTEDVKVLLDKGANPNARTRQGETAFNVAIERNDGESEGMAKALVAAGADIETPDKVGNAPIITAIKYKLTETVKLMLAKGVNIHTTAPDGTPLIDFAKKNGTPDIVNAIQTMLDREQAYADSLRTPERFHEIVRTYTMESCTFQYWTYFVASRQAPDKDVENQKKIDQTKARLFELIAQVQPYYTAASTNAMVKIANEAVKQIFNQLDGMVSNTNRADHGVGRDEDAKERCQKIVDDLPIHMLPVSINAVPLAPSNDGKPHGPLQAQMPMDPSSHAQPVGVSPMLVPNR